MTGMQPDANQRDSVKLGAPAQRFHKSKCKWGRDIVVTGKPSTSKTLLGVLFAARDGPDPLARDSIIILGQRGLVGAYQPSPEDGIRVCLFAFAFSPTRFLCHRHGWLSGLFSACRRHCGPLGRPAREMMPSHLSSRPLCVPSAN